MNRINKIYCIIVFLLAMIHFSTFAGDLSEPKAIINTEPVIKEPTIRRAPPENRTLRDVQKKTIRDPMCGLNDVGVAAKRDVITAKDNKGKEHIVHKGDCHPTDP